MAYMQPKLMPVIGQIEVVHRIILCRGSARRASRLLP